MTGPALQLPPADPAVRPATARRPLTRIAVVGECNSGKTSLVNAVLGAQLLPASFVTRTRLPTVVEFGARQRLVLQRPDRSVVPISWETCDSMAAQGHRIVLRAPLPALQRWRLVDTPGLGQDSSSGDGRTRSLCRHVDVVLWCTSALQAWKASERSLWLAFSARTRAKGILVVTFADLLRDARDAGRVKARLQAEVAPYFQAVVTTSELHRLLGQNDQTPCERVLAPA